MCSARRAGERVVPIWPGMQSVCYTPDISALTCNDARVMSGDCHRRAKR